MQLELEYSFGLSAEEIVRRAKKAKKPRDRLMEINRLFREQDESRMFPVAGKYDATERVIKRVRERFRRRKKVCGGLAYAKEVEGELLVIFRAT